MLNEIKLKRLPPIASGINDDHAEAKNWENVGTEGDFGASDILQVQLYQNTKRNAESYCFCSTFAVTKQKPMQNGRSSS